MFRALALAIEKAKLSDSLSAESSRQGPNLMPENQYPLTF